MAVMEEIKQLRKLLPDNEKGDEEYAKLMVHIQHLTNLPLEFIVDVITEEKSDQEIYRRLREKYFGEEIIDYHQEEYYLKSRAKKSAEIIRSILKTVQFPFDRPGMTVVDLGCGDGSIALAFKKYLNNPKLICVDIADWFQNYARKEIELKITDGKSIPLPDKSVDLLIAFNSIHHMKEYKLMIKEISRVLKKGGYLIIKEHDCQTVSQALILDIHHAIYEMVLKKIPPKNYLNEYYANYFSEKYLKTELTESGLKFVSALPTGKFNYLRNYFALFRQIY